MRTPTFNRVYDENLDFLYRCARRRGLADSDVDDVLQEVFIIAYRKLHSFEHRSTVQTWLYGILMNVSRDHERKRQRFQKQQSAFHNDPIRSTFEHTNVDSKIDADHLLAGFLQTLKARDRLLFELFEFEQYTGREVAAELSIKVSTAYDRRHSLRQAFKSHVMSEAPASVQVHDVVVASRRHRQAPAEARERIRGFVLASVGSKAIAAGPLGSLLHIFTTPFGLGGLAALAVAAVGLGFGERPAPPSPLPAVPPLVDDEPPNVDTETRDADQSSDPDSFDDDVVTVVPPPGPKRAPTNDAKPDRPTDAPIPAPPQPRKSLIDTLSEIRAALDEGRPEVALDLLTSMDPPQEVRLRWTRLHVEALCELERPTDARAIAEEFDSIDNMERCWEN